MQLKIINFQLQIAFLAERGERKEKRIKKKDKKLTNLAQKPLFPFIFFLLS
jgi:hypothetical protein